MKSSYAIRGLADRLQRSGSWYGQAKRARVAADCTTSRLGIPYAAGYA